jgi:acyl-CoA hydrolase
MPPFTSQSAAECAGAIVARVGRDVRIAVPIGIGKPVALLDALYRMAEADRELRLSIFTGLTLQAPRPRSLLEARFVEPFLARTLGSYRPPLYASALRRGTLPPNVKVHEFFLQAGALTHNDAVQRDYISLNYTHVAQRLQRMETNVLAQAVAPGPDTEHVSLSANTDIALDMMGYVTARRNAGRPMAVACEVQPQLPYMYGDAERPIADFDVCLHEQDPPDLFSVPKQPVSLQDYAMALHAATLIKDGGTLQIGIGTFSDALTHALILRHRDNATFRDMLERLGGARHPDADLAPFTEGLYGCTELVVDGYLALMRAGILKRTVEDDAGQLSVLDAGFLIGNRAFYEGLATLDRPERERIRMRGISFTNALAEHRESKQRARRHARFVNSAMTVTLLGAASSDATEDGRVVSGVGGQLDLVLQAHALPEARSVIAVRSHRRSPFKLHSNIVWRYGNCTVPRSLRDIVVSEYGIADVRGLSDRDTIAAMLAIAHSDCQAALVDAAKRVGKLEPSYRIAPRGNTAERIDAALGPFRRSGALPMFPHGTEMTDVEQSLAGALAALKELTPQSLWEMTRHAFGRRDADEQRALARLGLNKPASLKERVLGRLVLGALRREALARGGTGASVRS